MKGEHITHTAEAAWCRSDVHTTKRWGEKTSLYTNLVTATRHDSPTTVSYCFRHRCHRAWLLQLPDERLPPRVDGGACAASTTATRKGTKKNPTPTRISGHTSPRRKLPRVSTTVTGTRPEPPSYIIPYTYYTNLPQRGKPKQQHAHSYR